MIRGQNHDGDRYEIRGPRAEGQGPGKHWHGPEAIRGQVGEDDCPALLEPNPMKRPLPRGDGTDDPNALYGCEPLTPANVAAEQERWVQRQIARLHKADEQWSAQAEASQQSTKRLASIFTNLLLLGATALIVAFLARVGWQLAARLP